MSLFPCTLFAVHVHRSEFVEPLWTDAQCRHVPTRTTVARQRVGRGVEAFFCKHDTTDEPLPSFCGTEKNRHLNGTSMTRGGRISEDHLSHRTRSEERTQMSVRGRTSGRRFPSSTRSLRHERLYSLSSRSRRVRGPRIIRSVVDPSIPSNKRSR